MSPARPERPPARQGGRQRHRHPGNGEHPVMTSDMEGQDGDTPFGLLMWGQAGVYNAVDDRMVIAAVADSAVGVVRPARLSAGPGLTVNVSAGWLAIASCDDGTNAVVGARQTHTVVETAGSIGAARRDHLWCYTEPDTGRWDLQVVPEAQTLGRPGVSLGVIIVPAGANLASQFTFSQWVPTLGRHSDASGVGAVSGTTMTRVTAAYPIAPYQMVAHNVFEVNAWGEGYIGANTADLLFRAPLSSSPITRINPAGWIGARERFDWECLVRYLMNPDGNAFRSSVRVIVTRWPSNNVQQGTTAAGRSVAASRNAWGAAGSISPAWMELFVQCGWGSNQAGQQITCYGSTFDTFGHYWGH